MSDGSGSSDYVVTAEIQAKVGVAMQSLRDISQSFGQLGKNVDTSMKQISTSSRPAKEGMMGLLDQLRSWRAQEKSEARYGKFLAGQIAELIPVSKNAKFALSGLATLGVSFAGGLGIGFVLQLAQFASGAFTKWKENTKALEDAISKMAQSASADLTKVIDRTNAIREKMGNLTPLQKEEQKQRDINALIDKRMAMIAEIEDRQNRMAAGKRAGTEEGAEYFGSDSALGFGGTFTGKSQSELDALELKRLREGSAKAISAGPLTGDGAEGDFPGLNALGAMANKQAELLTEMRKEDGRAASEQWEQLSQKRKALLHREASEEVKIRDELEGKLSQLFQDYLNGKFKSNDAYNLAVRNAEMESDNALYDNKKRHDAERAGLAMEAAQNEVAYQNLVGTNEEKVQASYAAKVLGYQTQMKAADAAHATEAKATYEKRIEQAQRLLQIELAVARAKDTTARGEDWTPEGEMPDKGTGQKVDTTDANKKQIEALHTMKDMASVVSGSFAEMFTSIANGSAKAGLAMAKFAATALSGIAEMMIKLEMEAYMAAAVAAIKVSGSAAGVPGVGWMIAGPAALAMLGMLTALIPSASGGWDLPSGGPFPSVLHSQEMVLPASIANRIRGMADEDSGGGGGAVTINISAMDGASVYRTLRENQADFVRVIREAQRDRRL